MWNVFSILLTINEFCLMRICVVSVFFLCLYHFLSFATQMQIDK